MAKVAVILPAAGKSQRFSNQSYKKQFAPLADRAVWIHAVEKFVNRPDVKQIIVVIDHEDREMFQMRYSSNIIFLGLEVVEGGAERCDSVEKALARVRPDMDLVCVHDAARPCLTEMWIDEIFGVAERTGAAIYAIPIAGTIKRVKDQKVVETVSREGLWEAQTPQVFRRELLLKAYAQRGGFNATDEAQLVERLGEKVTVVPGSPLNLKIATANDLRLAEQAVKSLPRPKLNAPLHPFADDDMWK